MTGGPLLLWVRQLVIALILVSCAEWLAPEGSLKRYVRFSLGLVLTAVMLGPVFQALHLGIEWASRAADNTTISADTSGTALDSALTAATSQQTLAIFKTALERRAALLAETVPGVAKARVVATVVEDARSTRFGTPTSLRVWVQPGQGSGAAPIGNVPPVSVPPVQTKSTRPQATAVPALSEPLRQAVQTLLAREFGLPPAAIRVDAADTQP